MELHPPNLKLQRVLEVAGLSQFRCVLDLGYFTLNGTIDADGKPSYIPLSKVNVGELLHHIHLNSNPKICDINLARYGLPLQIQDLSSRSVKPDFPLCQGAAGALLQSAAQHRNVFTDKESFLLGCGALGVLATRKKSKVPHILFISFQELMSLRYTTIWTFGFRTAILQDSSWSDFSIVR